jgi:hypothetical protein
MSIKQIIIASLAGAMVLFLFDGAFQAIPNFGVRAVERIESNELTTPKFNELTNQMAYITTNETVSFVATRPADFYNLPKFFAIEFFSAFAIATVLAILFAKIKNHSLKERLLLTISFASIACLAIHIPYLNWWGFSFYYTSVVIVKTLGGWAFIAFIQNRYIFKIK